MENATQGALRSAVYRLLRPLVRVMLRHGMAYGSFAELARKVFVDESLALLEKSGKRGTISSVAAMTGLTRKEASRLADYDIDQGVDSDRRYNRAVRVITAWTSEARFLDRKGQPRELSLQGEDSFEALVREYSGDVPYAAMLSTLESSGTVKAGDGRVRLLDRAYLPTQTPVASLNILGSDVGELIATIDHNLSHARSQRVFQRKVSNDSVSPDAVAAFRELSRQKSQELLEEYHAWLSQHSIDDSAEDAGSPRYVSVGIYYFDDSIGEEGEP